MEPFICAKFFSSSDETKSTNLIHSLHFNWWTWIN